jgi:N6-adenosine-specific RNA methylase IME4
MTANFPLLPWRLASRRRMKCLLSNGSVKVTGEPGLGHWNRDRAEIMLIGGRGRPVAPGKGPQGERTWFASRPGGRGEKPDIALEWFETHFPNTPKVELWARKYRKKQGWASWGKDLPDGPWGLDDNATEALRMSRQEILGPGEKTPFDDEDAA